MANKLLLKRSAVPGKIPLLADLQLGELGLNTYDGKLFTRKDTGTPSIVEIGATGGAVWGSITGTLSNQTDLQNALNAKANASALSSYLPLAGGSLVGKLGLDGGDSWTGVGWTRLLRLGTPSGAIQFYNAAGSHGIGNSSGTQYFWNIVSDDNTGTPNYNAQIASDGLWSFQNAPKQSGTGWAFIKTSVGANPSITRGTAAPSGGSDGDVYMQYT